MSSPPRSGCGCPLRRRNIFTTASSSASPIRSSAALRKPRSSSCATTPASSARTMWWCLCERRCARCQGRTRGAKARASRRPRRLISRLRAFEARGVFLQDGRSSWAACASPTARWCRPVGRRDRVGRRRLQLPAVGAQRRRLAPMVGQGRRTGAPRAMQARAGRGRGRGVAGLRREPRRVHSRGRARAACTASTRKPL
jgi:hypothetical protein